MKTYQHLVHDKTTSHTKIWNNDVITCGFMTSLSFSPKASCRRRVLDHSIDTYKGPSSFKSICHFTLSSAEAQSFVLNFNKISIEFNKISIDFQKIPLFPIFLCWVTYSDRILCFHLKKWSIYSTFCYLQFIRHLTVNSDIHSTSLYIGGPKQIWLDLRTWNFHQICSIHRY